jgi:PAS domain S-box-containing protein
MRRDADPTPQYLKQLEAVCRNATGGLLVMDERQHCVYMNPAAELLTGFTLEEASGRPLHEVIHHQRPDGTPYPLDECPIDRAFPRGNQESGHEVFVHKDGSFYPVAYTASPLREAGGVVGTVVEVRDISREKEAEREREGLLAALERERHQLADEARALETINRISVAIAAELDLGRLVQIVTDEATALTGAQFGAFFYNVLRADGESYMLYTLSGAPREAFSKFPMPRNTEIFDPTFRGEGVVRIHDVTRDARFGKNAPYYGMPKGHLPVRSYLAVPVVSRSGVVIGGLFFGHGEPGVFTEWDERVVLGVAAQVAVAMDNASLFEAEQRARAAAEEARHKAEEESRLKDEFLATVSHELRTPLNSMLGWASMLRSRELDEAMWRRALETIERNARSQAHIIEDILDTSRIITGRMRLNVQPVDLVAVVDAAVDAVRPAAEAKALRLQTVLGVQSGTILGDPERLQQIVWNLLSNAVKFTPRGGKVQVLAERVNSHVEITVADTGEGIPEAFLPYVFDRFRQADGTATRQHGGLGLGLSIARHLVELHGGAITAESSGDGRGATFTVSLPLALVSRQVADPERVASAGATQLSFQQPPSLDGLRVLVVDDEPDARDLLAFILGECRAEVRTAASAAEALDALDEWEPEVLVSDIGMPGGDGFALIRDVREGASTYLPALALTAFARAEDRVRVLAAGFDAHLPKPADPLELAATVASLARRFR